LKTLPNREPTIETRVTLTVPIADLCPHSHEPQAGSTLAISYTVAACILELHAIEEWLPSQCTEAIDLETLCQRAARDAAAALGAEVTATADYQLRNGLRLCSSSTVPARISASQTSH
jgi:hypothetical protein